MWYRRVPIEDPEPHAVGLATSSDGIHWLRYDRNPVTTPSTGWEDYLIGSSQVVRVEDWFYAFYLGFQREPYTGRIGMARSRDGVSGWEKDPDNPSLGPVRPCSWNGAIVYKPAPLLDEANGCWHGWFNASAVLNSSERIGHAWSDCLW
jgi:predicted GH43/DUF377 family glycosyl hydrolase